MSEERIYHAFLGAVAAALVIVLMFTLWRGDQEMKHAPCEAFADATIRSVPYRCLTVPIRTR